MRDIYNDFTAAMERWQHIDYDVLDVAAAPRFAADHGAFRATIRDLEHRLTHVLLAAFDDCATMAATFKLLDSFEGLLDRDRLAAALEAKHAALLAAFGDEVAAVGDMFRDGAPAPRVPKNAARHSGAVKWVRGLVERAEAPLEKIRALSRAVTETEEARGIFAAQEALVARMRAYEREHVDAWTALVSEVRPAQAAAHPESLRAAQCCAAPCAAQREFARFFLGGGLIVRSAF